MRWANKKFMTASVEKKIEKDEREKKKSVDDSSKMQFAECCRLEVMAAYWWSAEINKYWVNLAKPNQSLVYL